MIESRDEVNAYHFKLFMDASPNLVFLTNGKTMRAANQALLDFIGYSSVEHFLEEHESICDLFEPYIQGALLKEMHGRTWIEVCLLEPTTHLAYIIKQNKMHAFKVYVKEIILKGEPLYIGILNDVTELEMQKERYTQAIEGSGVGLWDWDIPTNTLFFSPEWKAMLGYLDEELPNTMQTWQERVHPEDLEKALNAIDANTKGLTSFYQCVHRLKHKQGHWVWIDDRGKTFFDNHGNPKRMVGVHHDISALKGSESLNLYHAQRAEALLKLPVLNDTLQEAEFMQRSLEMAEDLTHSMVSFIHFVNDDEQSIELVTWSRRTLKKYCHTVHDTHYLSSQAGIWADALKTKLPVIVNDYANAVNKKGLPENHAHLERFISLPVLEKGKVVMLCGIGNKSEAYSDEDIQTLQLIANETWRLVQRKRNLLSLKEAQDMLLIQSRHAAMGEMISMIAHQWRQPISVIAMCANNMLLDIELETMEKEELSKQLSDILFQLNHLSHTIDDFRNFFKPDKNKEYVSVESILNEAIKLIEKNFETHLIVVSLHVQTNAKAYIYSRELLQVFLNILKNAKEALDEKEPLNRHVNIHVYEKEGRIVTRICNNGGSIDASVLPHIFEPYFTTKAVKNGTGLGLYMSKTIVEQHLLGKLSAYNTEEGVCFEVNVPQADTP